MRNKDTPEVTAPPRKLDAFLAQVQRRAYRMAVLATRQRDDALDIVQDAMFLLVRKYADRPEGEWAPLFHRILQTRITDWARRRKVRGLWQRMIGRGDVDDDPVAAIADAPGAAPEARIANAAALEAFERALQQLPVRQQQAFMLRMWEGFDVAQTAQAMGCTEGSVKTHYSRAVHALREFLEEHV